MPVDEVANRLVESLRTMGNAVALFEQTSLGDQTMEQCVARLQAQLEDFEERSTTVVLVAGAEGGEWTKFCMRSADLTLLCADIAPDAKPGGAARALRKLPDVESTERAGGGQRKCAVLLRRATQGRGGITCCCSTGTSANGWRRWKTRRSPPGCWGMQGGQRLRRSDQGGQRLPRSRVPTSRLLCAKGLPCLLWGGAALPAEVGLPRGRRGPEVAARGPAQAAEQRQDPRPLPAHQGRSEFGGEVLARFGAEAIRKPVAWISTSFHCERPTKFISVGLENALSCSEVVHHLRGVRTDFNRSASECTLHVYAS